MSRRARLRVVAGSARGRRLVAPAGDRVRPTMDVVKEAMFSALEARGMLRDATVLDLYAGSGALAIEALSRGAARAVLVEHDRHALSAVAMNLRTVGFVERARVVRSDVARFLAGPPPAEAPFDLVCADPSYDTMGAEVTAMLDALTDPGWLAGGAIVTVERPIRHEIVTPAGLRTASERTFGDTLLAFIVNITK